MISWELIFGFLSIISVILLFLLELAIEFDDWYELTIFIPIGGINKMSILLSDKQQKRYVYRILMLGFQIHGIDGGEQYWKWSRP